MSLQGCIGFSRAGFEFPELDLILQTGFDSPSSVSMAASDHPELDLRFQGWSWASRGGLEPPKLYLVSRLGFDSREPDFSFQGWL